VSWETIGFPVIDRSGSGRLRGVDLVSISKSEDKYFLPAYNGWEKNHQRKRSVKQEKNLDRADLSSADENNLSDDEPDVDHIARGEDLDHNLSQPLLLLCQQSEIGDLYCQRIQILPRQAPRCAPVQLK
jgi:hypothetical protein